MLASLAPTAVKVYPLAATGIEVRATFHQANGGSATYARFEISTAANFATLDYDSGQVAITAIADGAEGVMVFPWIPTAADTYYYRLCFWDDTNVSQTTWLTWNGTTVSTGTSTVTVRPTSDSSVAIPGISPGSPTTHFDKVDEESSDGDTTCLYVNTAGQTRSDVYNAGSGVPSSVKSIAKVTGYVNARKEGAGNAYVTVLLNTGTGTEQTIGADTYGLFSQDWTTNPDTSAAFSIAEANALKVGVKLRNATVMPRCTQVYAVITCNIYVFTFADPGDNALVIGFPANATLTAAVSGQDLTMTLTLDDTYSKPPRVTMTVDAQSLEPDTMTVTGSYAYTFVGRLKVATGWHQVSALIGNVWTVVSVTAISVYVPPVTLPADVRVYQGDREVPAQHVHVSEPCLPEYCTATFDTPEPIQGAVVISVQAGGLKRFPMEVTRVDGLTVTACSRLKRSLAETMTLSYLSIAMLDLLQLMVTPWIVQGRTDLITGTWDMLDTETTREDIVTQIATRCGVALAERDGTIVVLPAREDDLPEAVLAVDAKDPTVTPSVNYDSIRNVIRQAYQLDRYPIPPNAATNHDAAQWTGTASDVAVSASSIRPPSGSAYCLKGNGLCKRTVAFNKGDYDLLRFRYSPAALGQALEVRLYSDATNYWTKSRTYAGAAGAGFAVLGSAQTDEITKTITFTAARLAQVTIATTDRCRVRIELKSGATSLWTSGDNTTDAEGRIILVPEAIYKAGTADSMVLTFGDLYAVGSSWGVTCTSVSGREYYSYLSGTPGADAIDWSDTRTYIFGATAAITTATGQPISCPVHSASAVRTVPDGALVGSQRYYLHIDVYAYASFVVGALKRSFDLSLPPTSNDHPSYGRAFIRDGQLWVDEFGGAITLIPGADEAYVIQLRADIMLYTLKASTVTVTVWDYRDWSYGTTYPLWEDVTLKLSDFTASGSPTNAIIAYGLYAATDYYVDELYVERTTPRWQWVEVQDDDSIAQWGLKKFTQKTGDAHSASSALALASGMLEDLKDPAQEYQVTYPMTLWLALGDSVSVGDEVLSVASLSYGEGLMTASIGRTTGNLRDTLLSLARRQDALEREL